MKPGFAAFCAAALAAAALAALPADARTTSNRLKSCNEEWKTMKANNSVGDKKYADFRKECLARSAATDSRAAAPNTTTAAPAPSTMQAPPPASQPPAAQAKPPTSARGAAPPSTGAEPVFPTAVAPKFANEKVGLARRHTCLEQYNANKTTGANAGLTWLKPGGGYYSECNKRLKG